MKLSVSLTGETVAILDELMKAQDLPSRSAAVTWALRAAAQRELPGQYEAAWSDWAVAGEEDVWSAATADGLTDAPR